MYKPLAAIITPILLTVLSPLGITADTTVENALNILVVGVITIGVMYLPKLKR